MLDVVWDHLKEIKIRCWCVGGTVNIEKQLVGSLGLCSVGIYKIYFIQFWRAFNRERSTMSFYAKFFLSSMLLTARLQRRQDASFFCLWRFYCPLHFRTLCQQQSDVPFLFFIARQHAVPFQSVCLSVHPSVAFWYFVGGAESASRPTR